MPTLQNRLKHKKNTKVSVNGTIYVIDGKGLCHDVAEEDAKKLLQNDAWRTWPRASIKKEPPPPPPPPPPSGKIKVVTQTGIIDPAEEYQKSQKEVHEPQEEGNSEEYMKSQKADPKPAEERVPEGDEEWPTPTVAMSLTYLREMADAYEVPYHPRTGVKRLVADITAAMFEED